MLGSAVLASARWAPASAGHRLIEVGWMPSSAAVFVRGRMGGWREREDGSWTVPVTNDL
ncbi:hypothetical protein [Nocardiopsis dassonvillei]|uniref:hypothetical protein n=1 Tax=Nocardiopsis dassonvillei TaxID=2014 RepID=UPI003F57531E